MIGIFDSGLGGLTILKQVRAQLPAYDILYLGDNARAPYGPKSQSSIHKYSQEALDFMFAQGCELIIIACNTASSKSLQKIQETYIPQTYPDKKVLGVITPITEYIKNKHIQDKLKIAIIGTQATINSKAYEKELTKASVNMKIYSQKTPLLVPLIEEGWENKKETKMILKKYLHPLKIKDPDIMIMACTHYPLIREKIQRIMGNKCQVLDTPQIIGKKLKKHLNEHPYTEKKLAKTGQTTYYTTDEVSKFKEMGQKFLKERMQRVKKISL